MQLSSYFAFLSRTVLQRLPDKGKKLIETQAKVEERLLNIEQEAKALSTMFAGMNLSSCPRVDVNQMEWTGKVSSANISNVNPSDQQGNEENERDIVNILLSANLESKVIIDERYCCKHIIHFFVKLIYWLCIIEIQLLHLQHLIQLHHKSNFIII